jgi:hypothetical protein
VKTATVITASTTPYSAMVCPSSRLGREANKLESFSTWFTSLLRAGEKERKPLCSGYKPLKNCLVTPEKPPYYVSAWPRRLIGFVAKQHRPTVSGPESLVLGIPAPVPYIE